MDEAKRIAIERWLARAGNDLRTAETMLKVQPPTTDTVCFHAQQCVEKLLKAFLVYKDKHVEKTHYLPHLIELCSQLDPAFQSLKDMAIELTDYAVTNVILKVGETFLSKKHRPLSQRRSAFWNLLEKSFRFSKPKLPLDASCNPEFLIILCELDVLRKKYLPSWKIVKDSTSLR